MGGGQGYQILSNHVYWNYPVTFGEIPEQRGQTIQVSRCEAGGANCRTNILEVKLEPGDCRYLNNWHEWNHVKPGERFVHNWRTSDPTNVEPCWYVVYDEFDKPRLTAFSGKQLPNTEYCPAVSRRYNVYIGLQEQLLNCVLHLPGLSMQA